MQGTVKGRNKPQITVVISNETKQKSNASITMATGERSTNLEERKIVKKPKLKSNIAALRKR